MIALGEYDRNGKGGLTLAEARSAASAHSKLYRSGIKDLKDHYETERRKAEAAAKAKAEAERSALERAQRGTLKVLLELYIEHLRKNGKSSWRNAWNIFNRNVLLAFPQLAEAQAADVSAAEFRDVLAKLTDAGKGRTAAKLRSYLRAAYQLALTAEHDPTAPPGLSVFRLEFNPLDRISTLVQFNVARERSLSWQELYAYMQKVEAISNAIIRDTLLLSLLLGGQRPGQLVRLKLNEIDLQQGVITLYDPKGKRTQPRAHYLPIQGHAFEIIIGRIEQHLGGEHLFTTTGRGPVVLETLSKHVKTISDRLVESGDARLPFQLRDIRRTAETLLASMGVSRDMRAQLQSHGLGGIQARHYDKHDYLQEKRAVLENWEACLKKLA
jgi:integrase